MPKKAQFSYITVELAEENKLAAKAVENMVKILDQKVIPNIEKAHIKFDYSCVVITLDNLTITLSKDSTGRGTPQELKLKIQVEEKAVGFKTFAKGREGQERLKLQVGLAMKWHEVYEAAKNSVIHPPNYLSTNQWLETILEN